MVKIPGETPGCARRNTKEIWQTDLTAGAVTPVLCISSILEEAQRRSPKPGRWLWVYAELSVS